MDDKHDEKEDDEKEGGGHGQAPEVTADAGLTASAGDTTGREKKLMAMVKQQKLAIRRLEISLRDEIMKARERIGWEGAPSSLATASAHRVARCALSSLTAPIQRLYGYDSVRLRQAWETWQRLVDGAGTGGGGGGGGDETDAAVAGKAAVAVAEKEKRLKALLARSQAIAQRLREDNEALRTDAQRREASLRKDIAALKDERASLESAIRAAALSSDFAGDYELQLLKAEDAALSKRTGSSWDSKENNGSGGNDVTIAELSLRLESMRQASAAEAESQAAAVSAAAAAIEQAKTAADEACAQAKALAVENAALIAAAADAKMRAADSSARASDLEAELRALGSAQATLRENLDAHFRREFERSTSAVTHELAAAKVEIGAKTERLKSLEATVVTLEAKVAEDRRRLADMDECEATIRALRRALSHADDGAGGHGGHGGAGGGLGGLGGSGGGGSGGLGAFAIAGNVASAGLRPPVGNGEQEQASDRTGLLTSAETPLHADDLIDALEKSRAAMEAVESEARGALERLSRAAQDALRETEAAAVVKFEEEAEARPALEDAAAARGGHALSAVLCEVRNLLLKASTEFAGLERTSALRLDVCGDSVLEIAAEFDALYGRQKSVALVLDEALAASVEAHRGIGAAAVALAEEASKAAKAESAKAIQTEPLIFTSPQLRLKAGTVFDLPLPVAHARSLLDWTFSIIETSADPKSGAAGAGTVGAALDLVIFQGQPPPSGVEGVEVVPRRPMLRSANTEHGCAVAASAGLHTIRLDYKASGWAAAKDLVISYDVRLAQLPSQLFAGSSPAPSIDDDESCAAVHGLPSESIDAALAAAELSKSVLANASEAYRLRRTLSKSVEALDGSFFGEAADILAQVESEWQSQTEALVLQPRAVISEAAHAPLEAAEAAAAAAAVVTEVTDPPDVQPLDLVGHTEVVAQGTSALNAGADVQIPFSVPVSFSETCGIEISWTVTSDNPGIGISVALCTRHANGSFPQLSPLQLFSGATSLHPASGRVTVRHELPPVLTSSGVETKSPATPATYVLFLDNSHSWIRMQRVSFKVELTAVATTGTDSEDLESAPSPPVDTVPAAPRLSMAAASGAISGGPMGALVTASSHLFEAKARSVGPLSDASGKLERNSPKSFEAFPSGERFQSMGGASAELHEIVEQEESKLRRMAAAAQGRIRIFKSALNKAHSAGGGPAAHTKHEELQRDSASEAARRVQGLTEKWISVRSSRIQTS